MMNSIKLGKSTAEKALFKIRQDLARNVSSLTDLDMDMEMEMAHFEQPKTLSPMTLPDVNRNRTKWKPKKHHPKLAWNTLTPDELPGKNDPEIPLIEIVQKRHASTHMEDHPPFNPF